MFRYDRLKLLCKEYGITKAHLNRLLGVGYYYLRDKEKAKADLDEDKVALLANALNTTSDYLRGKTDVMFAGDDKTLAELLSNEEKILLSITKDLTPKQVMALVEVAKTMLNG